MPISDPAYHKRWRERRAQARLELGLCVTCGERPHLPDIQRCSTCKKKQQKANRAWHAEWNTLAPLLGICRLCSKPNDNPRNKNLCAPCADRENEKKKVRRQQLDAERLAAGLCTRCGKRDLFTATVCKACSREAALRRRVNYRLRRESEGKVYRGWRR
jgi:hypothetical protein